MNIYNMGLQEIIQQLVNDIEYIEYLSKYCKTNEWCNEKFMHNFVITDAENIRKTGISVEQFIHNKLKQNL